MLATKVYFKMGDGPGGSGHLADAAAALDLRLTDEEVRRLEAPYTPRTPTGFE